MTKNLEKAAPPLELVLRGGDPEKVALWGCGTCHMSARTRDEAVACCAPWICEKCGKETNGYCNDCSKKERHAKAQARYDKAKKVPLSEYTGDWLCCDHCDEYYPDVDSLLDAHDDEQPTWAWGTTEQRLSLDADRIISDQLEYQNFGEGAFENISSSDLRELQVFLDLWAAVQDVKSYMVDNSVVVDFGSLVEKGGAA